MKNDRIREEQGARLAAAREQAQYKSAREAAIENSWPESSYRAHENGSRTIGRDDAERYAARFKARGVDVSARSILFGDDQDQSQSQSFRPPPRFLGERDLPVFAAVEGGPGELVVSTEPIEFVTRPWFLGEVRDGYAVVITGESMMPAYNPGDMAIVNPRLPPMRGKNHIIVDDGNDGDFRATIKKVTTWDANSWHVEQYNPQKKFKLERTIWSKALRVVGKYEGN